MGKLCGYKIIRGKIHVETGLHIGAGRESMEIGGTDAPIMRHPITHHPYVPGSSLKGKIRSLLELKYCTDTMQQGRPCGCGKCKVCKIFGSSNIKTTESEKTMTRVIFRDAFMTPESLQSQEEAAAEGGGYYSEVKNEISMNRETLTAQRGGLRTLERIIPGSELELEIVLRLFENDPVDEYVTFIQEGLALLQHDTLGGSGSRGYGKVSIKDLEVEDRFGVA